MGRHYDAPVTEITQESTCNGLASLASDGANCRVNDRSTGSTNFDYVADFKIVDVFFYCHNPHGDFEERRGSGSKLSSSKSDFGDHEMSKDFSEYAFSRNSKALFVFTEAGIYGWLPSCMAK